MGRRYLLEAFKARIARQITLWVFGSLLAIEAAILLPSYLKRENELIATHESLIMTSVEIALLTPQAGRSESPDTVLIESVLAHLESQSVILGGAVYEADGSLLARHGLLPVLVSDSSELVREPVFDAAEQVYDSVIDFEQAADQAAASPYLVVRYDAHPIQQELSGYTFRMISMITLISVCVTLGTMIGVERLVIRPVLYLHNDLRIAAKSIRQGIRGSQFQENPLRKKNELGEVITAFESLYAQTWQALDDRKAAHLSEQQERDKAEQLRDTLDQLHQTQAQLVQSEKMSGLGQLVAGIAHEINNPISFIHGNLTHVQQYMEDLLGLVQLYQDQYTPAVAEIQSEVDAIDLDFLQADLPKLLVSMKTGSQRVRSIVLSLRNFSRLDESSIKPVDITEGLRSTLMLLSHRFKDEAGNPVIQVVEDYAQLPLVECYAGLLNQVFMNILTNAIEAFETGIKTQAVQEGASSFRQITLRTSLIDEQWVEIAIANNGPSLSAELQQRIFEPFFTTKDVGKGVGMGLSVSYQIVTVQHGGKLVCFSTPDAGTEFVIQIPVKQSDV